MGKKTKGINNKNQGGIDFIRAKKKVGRKIKKAANATDTTVRAKRITLPGQVLGAEGKGAAVTQRGLSLPELLGQCAHYSERVRKDALDGIAELLQAHPEALVASAATVVEKVAERLVDREKVARDAARAALRLGVLPALGPRGLAPFAPALILHVGAALTHVHPAVRRDAPGALDAILDVAPDLVAANDPAATLGHLAELLRRGDDAASSALVAETDKARAENATSDDRDDYGARSDARGGLSRSFGDMTASRVGPQAPDARLRLLTSCRRFLEVLARRHGRASDGWGTAIDGSTDRSTEPATTTWRWGPDVGCDFGSDDAFGGSTNGGGDGPSSGSPLARGIAGYPSGAEHGAGAALHAYRATRAPPETRSASAAASGGGATNAGGSVSFGSVSSAAAELAAVLFAAWDEATPTLSDAGGTPCAVRVRGMTEALACLRLALALVDERPGAIAGEAAARAGALGVADRVVGFSRARGVRLFPAAAPAGGGAAERRALVAHNLAAARLLSAVADGAVRVREAERREGGRPMGSTSVATSGAADLDVAADEAAAATAGYLAQALRGEALSAGACGEAEPTREGDMVDLLRGSRVALAREERRAETTRGDEEKDRRAKDDARDADDAEDSHDDFASSSPASRRDRALADLADAVTATWTDAVSRGPPERRAACVALLARALPSAAARRRRTETRRSEGSSEASEDASLRRAASWLRPFARLLWELKHHDPRTTETALRTLRAVASRTPAGCNDALARALGEAESELAPFFARVPPPETAAASSGTAPGRPKPGPFSRLPLRTQVEAIALLGALPTLSPATLRAAAAAATGRVASALAPVSPELARRFAEAAGANAGAAPLALTVSFLVALLTTAPSWAHARAAAPAAARALRGLGDAWAGASLATPAALAAIDKEAATIRAADDADVRRGGGTNGSKKRKLGKNSERDPSEDEPASDRRSGGGLEERRGAAHRRARATFGVLVLVAVSAEADGGRVPASAPASVEDAAPGLVADALIFAAREERHADAAEEEEDTPGGGASGGGEQKNRRGSESPGAEGAGECLRNVCARILAAAPRWIAPTLDALERRAAEARDAGDAGGLARVAGAAERVVVRVASRVPSSNGPSNGLRTDFGRAAGALAEALGEAAEALARRKSDAPGAGRAAKAARRAKRALLESVEAR
jgi:pre-rRNA-processing protein IPI1